MLFILVFAVGLGLTLRLDTVGLGLPILMVGPAAVLRAAPVLVDRKRRVRPVGFPRILDIVAESIWIVTLIVVAGVAAFAVVCFPVGVVTLSLESNTTFGALPALLLGGLAALVVIYFVGRKRFPPRDWPEGKPEANPIPQRPTDLPEG